MVRGAEDRARGHSLKRAFEAAVEIWRERRAERRAQAAARLGVVPRVPRSTFVAALDARLAVRSGVRLDDFLRHRLARYATRLPVPLEGLPVTFDVEGGEAVVRPRPRARLHGPRPEAAATARALGEREGPWAAREIVNAEAELESLDARAAAAWARADAVERELAEALASRQIVGRPAVEATAEQLGRPPVDSSAPIHALRLFVATLLAAEAWRFSGPVLAASGVAPDGLEAALRASPLPAALALALAVGAAAAAFTFAGLAVARALDAASAADPGVRQRLLCVAATGSALLVPAVTAAAAAPQEWGQLAVLATVPFAGAALWRAAAGLDARRASAAEAALAWDRDRAREAIERGRREELCLRAAADLAGIEAERALARRRLRKLNRAAIAAERRADLAARAEADRLDRLSDGLACALELDRYLYVRLAAERAHAPLERPARARVESAVTAERLGVAG